MHTLIVEHTDGAKVIQVADAQYDEVKSAIIETGFTIVREVHEY